MHKGFLKIAALVGLLSVAMGAFGAHALKGMISDHAIATFETGVRYQFYHVIALLVTGILYKEFRMLTIIWAGTLFIAGIILFSGSLYALAFVQATIKPGYQWIGAITPIGGLCFITGWFFLLFSFFKKQPGS
jgi:uncharacterized membrane protein YgdD (TMEM256/DUF423 family)